MASLPPPTDLPVLVITHLGVTRSSLFLSDVDPRDEFEQNQQKSHKLQLYVPVDQTIRLPLTTSVSSSYQQGSIRGFIERGLLSAFVDLGATSSTSFTALTDTPADYTGQADKFVKVNATEDGLEFVDLPTPAQDFTDLGDTPADYTGQAGNAVVVNATEDGLTFVPGGGGGSTSFTGLIDTPANYTGSALQFVRVNAAGTELEFVDAPAAGVVESLAGFGNPNGVITGSINALYLDLLTNIQYTNVDGGSAWSVT